MKYAIIFLAVILVNISCSSNNNKRNSSNLEPTPAPVKTSTPTTADFGVVVDFNGKSMLHLARDSSYYLVHFLRDPDTSYRVSFDKRELEDLRNAARELFYKGTSVTDDISRSCGTLPAPYVEFRLQMDFITKILRFNERCSEGLDSSEMMMYNNGVKYLKKIREIVFSKPEMKDIRSSDIISF